MCGIAGVTWRDLPLVSAMALRLAHRGPDQSGVFTDGSVTLGHRRLSVLDVSERGRQPMSSDDGSITVVYNGEIYNFAHVRQVLEGYGHAFRSECDTEVIVHAYAQWGRGCVQWFSGMFAFAVWDARAQELFLARDRMGIKPLYYAILGGPDRHVIFASEMKAVLECAQVSRDIDVQALYHYIGFEFVPAPATMLGHVRKLPPGHHLRWSRGRAPVVERYWRMRVRAARRSRREHEEVLRATLLQSVERQLMADVRLGAFLSGGIDSSAIVAAMNRLGVSPLDTFTLHYDDPSFSELEYAKEVADAFGARHHVIKIDPITPDMIATCCWHLDEPMADLSAMPFYLLCRQVAAHVTVCLSGEGGDELLSGYDRFRASRLHRYYSVIPRPVRQSIIYPLMNRFADRPRKKGAVNMIKRFLEGDMLPEDGRHMRWQYFCAPRVASRLFAPRVGDEIGFDPFGPVRSVLEGAECDDALAEEIYIDTCLTLPDSLLMKADKMSMAHGLEVRVPLLDDEFVEVCSTIPSSLKLEGLTTKAIVRAAMADVLPKRIRTRGKQGYSLPIKNWLRGELREFMQDTVASSPVVDEYFDRGFVNTLIDEHMQKTGNHSHLLWGILNFAVWHRLFVADGAAGAGRRSAAMAAS